MSNRNSSITHTFSSGNIYKLKNKGCLIEVSTNKKSIGRVGFVEITKLAKLQRLSLKKYYKILDKISDTIRECENDI